MPPSQALLALHTIKLGSLVLDVFGQSVVSAHLVSRGERGRVVEVLALHKAWRASLVHQTARPVLPGAGHRDRTQ